MSTLTPDPAQPSRYTLRLQDWALVILFFIAINALFGTLSILLQDEIQQPFIIFRVVTVTGLITSTILSLWLWWVFSRDAAYAHQKRHTCRKSVSIPWED